MRAVEQHVPPIGTTMQREPRDTVLMIWPSVAAWRLDGQLWLDRKFKDGMEAYCARWPGRVRVVMRVENVAALSPFGAWRWEQAGAPFTLDVIEPGRTLTAEQLRGVDVLLASADDYRQLDAAALCATLPTACLYVIEYTLRTRLDMERHSSAPLLKKLKTAFWHLRNERRIVRALRLADGIQANGSPAFKAYGPGSPSALLYWDTRLPRARLMGRDALEAKLARLRENAPLRLAFSGRLIAAKGADAMVPLALRLRQLGVPFTLDIFGAGELADGIRAAIAAHGLADTVRLRGAVDFDDALMPAIKDEVDVFVCCHRQGDPSCTYAETLGCGVPMVGFANESLAALVEENGIGWTVPMGSIPQLAARIAELAGHREEICARSSAALRFAENNHFENVFDRRIAHCIGALGA